MPSEALPNTQYELSIDTKLDLENLVPYCFWVVPIAIFISMESWDLEQMNAFSIDILNLKSFCDVGQHPYGGMTVI